MDRIHTERCISCIIEGGATGADRLGREWAISRNIPYETYAAKWDNLDVPGAVVKTRSDGKKYNAKAGFDRNGDMLKANPDGVVAFPGGRGTDDMVRQSGNAKVPVWKPAEVMKL